MDRETRKAIEAELSQIGSLLDLAEKTEVDPKWDEIRRGLGFIKSLVGDAMEEVEKERVKARLAAIEDRRS